MRFILSALLKRSDQQRIHALLNNSEDLKQSFPSYSARYSALSDSPWLEQFNAMHSWQARDLHPALLQVKSLPLQLRCILDKSSPFPALGLVHVGNQITSRAPLMAGEYTLHAQIIAIIRHRKGLIMRIATTAELDGQCVYEARSDYLYRIRDKDKSSALREVHESTIPPLQELEHYHYSTSAGRLYAKISGDYNPIHLWPLSAKLFGFQRPIVHGMHSLSLCLSTLRAQGLITRTFTVDNQFIQPAVLPSNAVLCVNDIDTNSTDTREFQLLQQHEGQPDLHSKPILRGTVIGSV
ncbi:MaoC family dehydratase [Alteromonas flava]|uniref:MaoC family dehydratase n=1 Tax=Alteromonas flava TaxID=2048003 RepID=UPI000C2946A0|nr:MaoC/PaaZ C-terminal domain-containing protein [Alteromonas flava]